jgi:hypothetical protein
MKRHDYEYFFTPALPLLRRNILPCEFVEFKIRTAMPDASVFEYPGIVNHDFAPEIKRLVMLHDTQIRIDSTTQARRIDRPL